MRGLGAQWQESLGRVDSETSDKRKLTIESHVTSQLWPRVELTTKQPLFIQVTITILEQIEQRGYGSQAVPLTWRSRPINLHFWRPSFATCLLIIS